MSAGADRFAIFIALILSTAAAIASAQRQPGEALQQLQWLVAASTAPEATEIAGAIGKDIEFPVSP